MLRSRSALSRARHARSHPPAAKRRIRSDRHVPPPTLLIERIPVTRSAHTVVAETQNLRSGPGISRLAEIATAAPELPSNPDAKDLMQQLTSARRTALKAMTA